MAKFLDTTGVSYHLQQLINNASVALVLISPYLKFNDRLRLSLEDKDRLKIDMRIIFGKSELQPPEVKWLAGLQFVRVSFCKNLHAKCYLNEKEALITSMNLYEFSQVNNEEMGIYVTREDDPQLYKEVYTAARRLVRISKEVRLADLVKGGGPSGTAANGKPPQPQTVPPSTTKSQPPNPVNQRKAESKETNTHHLHRSSPTIASTDPPPNDAHCLRCKRAIPTELSNPYCNYCSRIWSRFNNADYKEKYCHLCGEEEETSMNKPVCMSCYRKHRKQFKFNDALYPESGLRGMIRKLTD